MFNDLKISVAMTTYNGEKYLLRQLLSIVNQSLPPDEVIICDDGSTDNTVGIIDEFISSKHLSGKWFLFKNNPNLGWKKNFYKAIGQTKGNVIFFSDQDDIWHEDKIEKMSYVMTSNNIGCLFANKNYIDKEDNPMVDRQEKKHFTGDLISVPLRHSFYNLKTLGCCMCVSREIADLYLKTGYPEGGHDSQCGRLAALLDQLFYLDLPVIDYRIHDNNSSGISGIASYGQGTREQRIRDIQTELEWLQKLKLTVSLGKKKEQLLEDCQLFLSKRLSYFFGGVSFLYLILNIKYYTGISMLLGDFAYKYDMNRTLGKIRWIILK